MVKEIWLNIPGYGGKYQVNESGFVRSWVRKPSYRILTQRKDKDGYIKYSFANQCFFAHRLVAVTFIPNPENKPQVNHRNGIRSDNRVENLEWVTCSENIKDCFDSRRKSQVGEKSPRAILTEEKVKEIRNKFKPYHYTRVKLAKEYGVSEAAIKKIINRENWSHI